MGLVSVTDMEAAATCAADLVHITLSKVLVGPRDKKHLASTLGSECQRVFDVPPVNATMIRLVVGARKLKDGEVFSAKSMLEYGRASPLERLASTVRSCTNRGGS